MSFALRSAVVRLLPLAVLAFANSTPAAVVTCQDAKAWVDAHPESLKNPTLKKLSDMHVAYRREVMGRLPVARKVALWSAHLDSFASQLTPAQETELAKIKRKFLNEKTFANRDAVKDMPTPKQLAAIFGDTLARHMFNSIGTPDSYESEMSEIAALQPKVLTHDRIKSSASSPYVIASSSPSPDPSNSPTAGPSPSPTAGGSAGPCNCHWPEDYCSSPLRCQTNLWPFTGCDQHNGCGMFWLNRCIGLCWM